MIKMAAIGGRRRGGEDEEQDQRRPRIVRDRKNPLEIFDDLDLYRKFRFRRQDIFHICDLLTEENQNLIITETRGSPLPLVLQVLLTLRFLATGTFQDCVGELIGVSQPTVSRTVNRILKALTNSVVPREIRAPTQLEADREKDKFMAVRGFPNVFALIDGTQVKLETPSVDEDAYICRHSYHSINVQIVCNSDLVVIDCSATGAGGRHDARVLRESALFTAMEEGFVNGFILGDSGYPLLPWLMTPHRNPNTAKERNYNRAHKSTRSMVERCIGVIKRRFHSLHTELRLRPEKSRRVILSCVALHNIARRLKLPEFEDEPLPPAQPNNQVFNGAENLNGRLIRDEIIRRFF